MLWLGYLQPMALGVGHDGPGDRVFTLAFGPHDRSQELLNLYSGVGHQIAYFGATVGERTGLIEGDNLHSAQLFKVGSALKEHATARPIGDCTQQGCRHADDQGTGRSDRQEDHPCVEVIGEGDSEQPRPDDDEERHRTNDTHCVPLLKAVEKALGARLTGLCLAHHGDDPRQGTLTGQSGHQEVEGTTLVQCTGKECIALTLLDRHRFTSEG